jgi:glycine dehydrogenase
MEAIKVETMSNSCEFENEHKQFFSRHVGPSEEETKSMLSALGYKDIHSFISAVVPETIRLENKPDLGEFDQPLSEQAALSKIKKIASKNEIRRNFIGLGYYNCYTPTVIQRNILENPCWYTQYTPYQPEISQGRLEALLNFQTLICEMTGLDVSNASLLDEATSAAEALGIAWAVSSKNSTDNKIFLVDENTHPQTIAVLKTRAEALGLTIKTTCPKNSDYNDAFGLLVSYPGSNGEVVDYSQELQKAKSAGLITVVATDLLALTLLKTPNELGADIAVGSAQRFGVPLGFGGPSAGFMAVKDEYKRLMPGRLIGVSKDTEGKPAMRLSLQTREQHIRREKATSNICTAQVLLAVMNSMYAVYHGPKGLKQIAQRVNRRTKDLVSALKRAGLKIENTTFFDTFVVNGIDRKALETRSNESKINLGYVGNSACRVSLDETTNQEDLLDIYYVLTGNKINSIASDDGFASIPVNLNRISNFLAQKVFNTYHSETEFLRYVRRLESRDLSLATSMIPLGSCTMKLNATSEMLPVTWAEFGSMHPFAPAEQTKGYQELFRNLEFLLAKLTGCAGVSLQPNAGSQGEYTGLLVVKAYQSDRGEGHRNICLIPKSAHGTNPASAVMAGYEVVVVACDEAGNIDLKDLTDKAKEHSKNLAVLMATYPSTHGVFEEHIQKVCEIVHAEGGQVYMDGANFNALVGLSSPERVGADVMHINLHKTFCIPHGGGGPGMGPIVVKEHLKEFLPTHPQSKEGATPCGGKKAIGPVSAAPYGSASILPISWMYMVMMGNEGLRKATEIAILNANYIAKKLSPYYPVLYTGPNGLVAHECILDLRNFKTSAGVEVEDVAKRLMDYGFHAPTVSFPVPGTMMIEPTESEALTELDRFCDAMIAIYNEIKQIEKGEYPKDNNPLKNAPHTATSVISEKWDRPYSREIAAFPVANLRDYKFWPAVGRVDGAFGDRNLICTCPDLDSY